MTAYTTTQLWLLIAASGALTFLIRYSLIAAEGHYRAPGWLVFLLPFVPIAVLSALIAPDLFLPSRDAVGTSFNPRLVAGLIAIVVAARWRNTLLTIACGFATLYLLKLIA